jgi:hypothetical protein
MEPTLLPSCSSAVKKKAFLKRIYWVFCPVIVSEFFFYPGCILYTAAEEIFVEPKDEWMSLQWNVGSDY